jgi:hypothetical protein
MNTLRLAAAVLILPVASACFEADELHLPFRSGAYQFQWKDAEFPRSDGFPVRVEISDEHIRVINERKHRDVPVGEIAEGKLMLHAKSGQWILGHDESDRLAESVGGCGDADAFVVDFEARVIWTCQWGP